MWLGGCRTRVWRGVRPLTRLPAPCWYSVWVFFLDSRWLGSNLHRLGFDSCRTGPIRLESGRIGRIKSYWPAAKTGRNGWERLKSALNYARTAEIGFEWSPNVLNLSFLNLILNICYFFCVFFFVLCFVLCFLPSSFFVLWTKAIVMCFLRIF